MLTNAKKSDSIKEIGGKAFHLLKLQTLGFKVPPFYVIPTGELRTILDEADDHPSKMQAIEQFRFPENWKLKLDPTKYYAVRSSAEVEDGNQFSFAGQFCSKLFVKYEDIEDAVKEVWHSAFSDTVRNYVRINGIDEPACIAVVVQEMIDADVSGVAFGLNPLTGNTKEHIISAVFGLGEGIVSGELDSDNYVVNNSSITKQIYRKTYQLKHAGQSVLVKMEVPAELQNQQCLDDASILALSTLLTKLEKAFNHPQDVEFATQAGELYLLQSRPITAKGKPQSNYILWDNSNIVESYPGVTTPLTFSFILSSYEKAYKQLSLYFGVNKTIIERHSEVFANTLGLIRGRVYYNLKSWYLMLALLPGYSINARSMETMMGVKERFDLPKDYHSSSRISAIFSMIRIVIKMVYRFFTINKERTKFMDLLNKTIAEYKEIDFSKKAADELVDLYIAFEKKLLNEWKAPLLNDLFAMMAFGRLQKKCAALGLDKENPNIHNDLLCGSSDIISVEPIHRTIELASWIINNKAANELFIAKQEDVIWSELMKGVFPELKTQISQYIHDFGERCIGELKLETISYSQKPELFIKVLKTYVERGISQASLSGHTEHNIRNTAEVLAFSKLRFRPLKKWLFKRSLRNTRLLVSNRENLRYERTRAFGIVRELFSHIGSKFAQNNIISDKRDIFYLSKEEIIGYVKGTAISTSLKETIALRKAEFEIYRNTEAPSERFATYGTVFADNDFYATDKLNEHEGKLQGVGCCPGKLKGKVRVVHNPEELSSLEGDILVTTSTDPGWVVLFPTASAILVERGSLLSHSAIVSREMGIPCIVGISGLLQKLKTGDVVEMNGSTGEVFLLTENT